MKHFACGDVIPGCAAVFSAPSVDLLMEAVSLHARQDHGVTDITPDLVATITSHITSVG
jgi:predicted small metal-binding protein